MINWFNMPAEGLSNGGLFEIKELTATENKVYQKDGEVYNKVTVNVEGGGGSSDFSTAEVTITTGTVTPHTAEIDVAFCVEEEDHNFTASPMVVEDNDSITLKVVLYKGCALASIPDYNFFSVSVSGDIIDNDGKFIITGDGSITINNA